MGGDDDAARSKATARSDAAAAHPATTAYPAELAALEDALIRARRAAADPADAATPRDAVGVGLSGGGIRSATFCLGVFQGLAAEGLVRRIDVLSTVSGGGYFGAFFGRLFGRDAIGGAAAAEEVLRGTREPRILRNLRENGRYLAPNGAADAWTAAAIVLRNAVAVHLVALFAILVPLLLMIAVARLVEAGVGVAWKDALAGLGPLGALGVPWSPWLLPTALLVVLRAVPAGAAYWLVDHRRVLGQKALWIAAPTFLLGPIAVCGTGGIVVGLALGGAAALAVRELLASEARLRAAAAKAGREPSEAALAYALRRDLSDRLAGALVGVATTGAFGLVDTLGATLVARAESPEGLAGLWRALGGAVAGALGLLASAGKIVGALGARPGGGRFKLPVTGVALVVALLVGGALLVAASAFAHGLARRFCPAPTTTGFSALWPAWTATFAAVAVSVWFATNRSFVNRSSQHALYSARLTRAYLGASNPLRAGDASVTEPKDGDDVAPEAYWARPAAVGADAARPSPYDKGAPLHLVNVTINETFDGRSRTQQQDRKGLGMAVGPGGLSVGVRHHALFDWAELKGVSADARPAAPVVPAQRILPADGFRVFGDGATPERLTLGYWVGVSGAAFSTGAGFRTSLGLSVLTGLANVRLGYWWDAGVERCGSGAGAAARPEGGPGLRGLLAATFETQRLLLSEFVARFPGVAWRRWYLSDGGHFENLGGYELIRRRLKRIVLVDAEEDADYAFEGLSNLVRKARTDFGAEISFLDEIALDGFVDKNHRAQFGTLDQLRRGRRARRPGNPPDREPGRTELRTSDPQRRSLARAALATTTYADGVVGLLVYVKPTLLGDEPQDVLHYHATHPSFPHEPTTDQFFDEAQWESYRALGEHVARAVFTDFGATIPVAADAPSGGNFKPRGIFADPDDRPWVAHVRAFGGGGP